MRNCHAIAEFSLWWYPATVQVAAEPLFRGRGKNTLYQGNVTRTELFQDLK